MRTRANQHWVSAHPQCHSSRRWSQRLCGEVFEPRLAMAAGPLVITELMYDPAAVTAQEDAAGFKRDDFEFIELQNVSGQSLSLSGFTLAEGVEFTFGATTLAPNERVVVVRDTAGFSARYGAGANVVGEYKGTLSNGSDELILQNGSGTPILSFTYDKDWYPSTGGDGHSLVIINPNGDASQWDQPQAWRASSIVGGSPGREEGPVDQTPPSVPQGLGATLVDSTRVSLQWQPATDGESAIIGYRVYRDGVLLNTTTATTFADSSSLANSSYTYRVSAVNAFGLEGASSNQANIVIPPVGDDPEFADGKKVGSVTAIELHEISGVVASRIHRDVLWVHEDGPQTSVVGINATGQLLGSLSLSGVQSTDWEDIAIGPGPVAGVDYLYIADIGDNLADRSSITIYRVPEPAFQSQGGANQSVTLSRNQFDVITLRYPSGAVDAEALLVDPLSGDVYILTKEASPSRIFRAPAASLVNGANVVLTQDGQVSFKEPSAAEISPSGREILVRNENTAHLYVRGNGQTVSAALAGTPFVVPVIGPPKEPNGEAIGFDWAGGGYYTISEDQDPALYYFHRTSRLPGQPDPVSDSWHNAALPTDVNGDGVVEPLDVLVLINDIDANGSRALTAPASGTVSAYLDVNADNSVSAVDVLIVINRLNSNSPLSNSPLSAQPLSTPDVVVEDVSLADDSSQRSVRDQAFADTDWQQEVETERLRPYDADSFDNTVPTNQQSDRLGIRSRKAKADPEPAALDQSA